jgi:iron complex transport system ATP-binding protein
LNAIKINSLEFSYSRQKSGDGFSLVVENFSVECGEFISILGPNGCGKSTLLRIIANLLLPTDGTLELFGEPVAAGKHKNFSKVVSYVPQMSYSVFPFSVYEIVMMGRTPYLNMLGFEMKEDKDAVDEALAQLEIEHLAHKGINEISGGEAQRAFIARALAQDAKVILLDEPNSHLDIEHQIAIFELLKKINKEKGKTVITVSHDLNLVGIFTQRTVIMKSGRIILDGDKRDILTKENIKNNFCVEADLIRGTKDSFNVLINPVE